METMTPEERMKQQLEQQERIREQIRKLNPPEQPVVEEVQDESSSE